MLRVGYVTQSAHHEVAGVKVVTSAYHAPSIVWAISVLSRVIELGATMTTDLQSAKLVILSAKTLVTARFVNNSLFVVGFWRKFMII